MFVSKRVIIVFEDQCTHVEGSQTNNYHGAELGREALHKEVSN